MSAVTGSQRGTKPPRHKMYVHHTSPASGKLFGPAVVVLAYQNTTHIP
ncbi:hypothetical protein CORC01_07049 [Colletotrichum orchidophilum]|uniref:Uncharacterized protein n=1 Tax=Colletotrichum orchidophilum TaxID=1209926 RepID=A0A1G4B8C7_9PEZI|nr:uncharacterized protein CORC01_07049 [Colletotrichum orchidophilum]OHE97634.1 hypothetical protein CORC01_07049 [Colletotrichum orchidophilum]